MADDDQEAVFEGWLTQHGAAVLKVARAYTRTVDDCQDLTQEILLQVWRSVPRFQGRASACTLQRHRRAARPTSPAGPARRAGPTRRRMNAIQQRGEDALRRFPAEERGERAP